MFHSILATYVFWISFVFSIGPFWVVVMEVSKHTSWRVLFQNYAIFQIVGWAPQTIFIAIVVSFIGQINDKLLSLMHLVGGVIIIFLSYKMLRAKLKQTKFDFHWKTMVVISWSNPKVWISVPIGALSAQYTNIWWQDAIIFYLFSPPLFFTGLFFWAFLGRQGAKMAKDKFSYFTASLLALFGVYLVWQGMQYFLKLNWN